MVRGAALLGAALVLATDRALPLLYGLAFLLGSAETLADTAAPAILPRLVEARQLERANGRLSAAQIVLNEMVGPPLAGLLAGLTAAAALATGGTLYALAALLLLGLAPLARTGPEPAPPEPGPPGARDGVLRDIRKGLRFVLGHRTLRLTLAASALYGLVFSATFSMLVLLSERTLRLSQTGYGLLLAAGSVGAVAGSWLAPRAADRLPTVRLARWSLARLRGRLRHPRPGPPPRPGRARARRQRRSHDGLEHPGDVPAPAAHPGGPPGPGDERVPAVLLGQHARRRDPGRPARRRTHRARGVRGVRKRPGPRCPAPARPLRDEPPPHRTKRDDHWIHRSMTR
ncbi:MFS transporter [Streptomyces lasalocidi]